MAHKGRLRKDMYFSNLHRPKMGMKLVMAVTLGG